MRWVETSIYNLFFHVYIFTEENKKLSLRSIKVDLLFYNTSVKIFAKLSIRLLGSAHVRGRQTHYARLFAFLERLM